MVTPVNDSVVFAPRQTTGKGTGETSLRGYQVEGLEFLLSHRRAILGFCPGTGKTATALAALQKAGPWRNLIVAPKSVLSHWEDEAARWFPALTVVNGTGTAAARRIARDRLADTPQGPTALLVNYESLREDSDEFQRIMWGATIFDEGHRIKNRQAQVTKAAKAITKHPRTWTWLLTGTPCPNKPEELWSLLHLIDRHRFSSYWRWVKQYCDTEPLDHGWGRQRHAEIITGLKDGAVEAIQQDLANVLIYRTLEQLLPDLPAATITPIFVELDAEERRVYRELVKKAWSTLENGETLRTMNEISRMTRLRQIVSSMDALGAGRTKPGSKVAAAAEICADLEPEQVVVLTWSRAAAERVAAETGGEFIHGGVDSEARAKIMAGFSDGSVRVLAGTISTLGEGVDGMQVAHYMIRLDRDWTPSKNAQAIARIRRSGQLHDAVVVYDLIARNSLDEVIEAALAAKTSVIDALLARPMTMED